ncbi:MAG: TetR/AcrR family transcriptional regulator [Telmatospirillum sp.]|nr:TetR/AcrR family transcriptional regulator [Telmatospirillum sp.]
MLEEVGPAKLSLRAVSARIGVSPAAAYHHFDSRASLLGHLAAQGFRELAVAVEERAATAAPGSLLREAALAYFRFACRNPCLYQLMFGPEFIGDESAVGLADARTRSFTLVQAVIAKDSGLEPGSGGARSAALAGWVLGHGLASLTIQGRLERPEGLTDDQLVDRALQGFAILFGSSGVSGPA